MLKSASLAALCGLTLAATAQTPETRRTPPEATAAKSPVVSLNHFFVVLDAPSYAAMQSDPYLTHTFAPFEKRTTVRSDSTYTAAYWYGRQTYFEIFEPPSQGPRGASGIAFSVDGEGESAAIEALWKTSLGDTQSASVTRKTEDAEPVWFKMTAGKSQAAETGAGLRLWLMEYDRNFLAGWYPNLTKERGKTRGPVLDRYVAKIGKSKERETAVVGDIKELLLALDDADRALLIRHLVPAGWQRSDRDILSLRGPDGATIKVIPKEGARRGIIEVAFHVQGSPAPHEATLGSVKLTVTPTEARLRFVP